MSTHNQDNITRQKLQELKEIPKEFSFDAAKVWQKMEADLQPAKQRKNYMIWLTVAAVLLLIMLTTAIYNNGTKKNVAPSLAIKREIKAPTLAGFQQQPVNTAMQVDRPFNRKEKQTVRNKLVMDENVVEDATIAREIRNPVVEAPIVNIITPEIVNAINQPTATPVKKPKLRVVHINDLYKPVPEEIAKAEIKKQANEEVASEAETVIATPSKPFWKAKTPQKTAITLND